MFFHCLVSWAWLDWPLTDHYLSVLRRCWLGHMTCKIVPEKTYNVSSGMLSPTTIPSAVYWSVNQRINQSVNPAPPIRCLCIDFVHVTNCIYDYDFTITIDVMMVCRVAVYIVYSDMHTCQQFLQRLSV